MALYGWCIDVYGDVGYEQHSCDLVYNAEQQHADRYGGGIHVEHAHAGVYCGRK